MKNVIWIIGSNATGKTTQSVALHKYLNPEIENLRENSHLYIRSFNNCTRQISTSLTVYPNSTHIGKIQPNNCCGTDTLPKKAMIEFGYKVATNLKRKNIIIDGIMATGTWIDFIKGRKDMKINLYLFLLDFESIESNVSRLKERRGKGMIVTEETKGKLQSRLTYFRSLYKRMRPFASGGAIIEADLKEKTIHDFIKQYI